MQASSIITLAVKATAGGESYTYHVTVDGTQIASNRTLSPEETDGQRTLAEDYLSLFETRSFVVEKNALDDVGRALFETWLADLWPKIDDELTGSSRCFVIASEEPDVLNLPWSLLRIPGEDQPIGLNPNTSVRLHPSTDGPDSDEGDGRPGPLRVLYSACAPQDLGDLGYEKEEYQLLQTFSQRGQEKVAHFGCDLGSFDELQDRLRNYEPHVVHLTGHGAVVEGEGHFAFEDERGQSDLRPGRTLADDAIAGRGVQCVFVSGCQTAQAPSVRAVNGICQGLVNRGVPLAVGWAASILDDVATTFAESFYAEISAGTPIDRAVTQARRDAHRLCTNHVEDDRYVDASWTLPVLYTATTQGELYDDAKPTEEPPKPTVEQRPLPGMTEGHADYFIGRRREQQRLLPDLRSGDLNTVFLTGMGGVGKSTLATRLARSLEKDGFTPIAVPSMEGQPLTVGRLIDRCCEVFLDEELNDFYQRLRNENIDLRDRLRQLIRALNQNRFVLVLDNFEVNLDRQSREILNDDLAWLLPYLTLNLSGSSRCIVTTRYRPADLDGDLPRVATELSLSDFPESAFFKFLLGDDTVEERYLSGVLPRDLLSEVYDLLGGTPRFLEQVRKSLADMPADELRAALDTVDLPEEEEDLSDDEKNELRALRDEYVQDLFVRDLYHAVVPEASRTALSRAAVYTIPMTGEGFAAAGGVDESDVRDWIGEWQRRTFVTPVETQDSAPDRWTVPTLLRPWLLKQLSDEERTEAHRAAGEWLMEVFDADRKESHLGMHVLNVALEARARFLVAGEVEWARTVTDRLSGFFNRRAVYDEVIRLNEEMLEHETHPSPMNWLGRAHLERAEYDKAAQAYRKAKEAATGADRKEEARALNGLASIAVSQGEYERAREGFEEALQTRQEIGDRSGEATTRHNLASIALEQGEYERARKQFEEALQTRQEIGDWSGEATTRNNLASIALEQGEYERARKQFEEALQTCQEIGDWSGEATTRHNLASIALEQGEYGQARKEFEEALQTRQEIGDRSGEAATRHSLATIALRQGAYERAREGFEEALRIKQEIGDRSGEATTRHQLATIAMEQGEYKRARKEFGKSLEIKQKIGDRTGEAATRHNLATIALNQGEYERAREEFEEALQTYQEIGDRSGEAATWHSLATIVLNQGEYERAREEFERSLKIDQEIGNRSGEATTWAQLGILAARELGRHREGLRLLVVSHQIFSEMDAAQVDQVGALIQDTAGELGYDEKTYDRVKESALSAYDDDRGWSLLREAFPDADHPDDVPPSGGETGTSESEDA